MDTRFFALHGDICYSEGPDTLRCVPGGYLICEGGVSRGVFAALPDRYRGVPLADHAGKLILPGLVDLHTHAPQFAFRGLGMDLELLDWLGTYVYPEEAKYRDGLYARQAYEALARALVSGPNTRVILFATVHRPATQILMDILETTGLVCMVGKVNMDRNCPDAVREESAASLADTRAWLADCAGRYKNVSPILTPRFIPTCSDGLLRELAAMAREFGLPVQSHLSENRSEVEWVRALCPGSACYGDAYARFGLFGGEGGLRTVMAHGVLSDDAEMALLRKNGVWLAHCPQSNTNLSSGIAPVRRFLQHGVKVGLGSDVAGGCHNSIFRAMADAVAVSKLRAALIQDSGPPLTLAEAFYLGTLGGGSFFGNAGSFAAGYELDALVLDDSALGTSYPLSIDERLARAMYFCDDRHIIKKYARGREIARE